jgi:hypothetical protein
MLERPAQLGTLTAHVDSVRSAFQEGGEISLAQILDRKPFDAERIDDPPAGGDRRRCVPYRA